MFFFDKYYEYNTENFGHPMIRCLRTIEILPSGVSCQIFSDLSLLLVLVYILYLLTMDTWSNQPILSLWTTAQGFVKCRSFMLQGLTLIQMNSNALFCLFCIYTVVLIEYNAVWSYTDLVSESFQLIIFCYLQLLYVWSLWINMFKLRCPSVVLLHK